MMAKRIRILVAGGSPPVWAELGRLLHGDERLIVEEAVPPDVLLLVEDGTGPLAAVLAHEGRLRYPRARVLVLGNGDARAEVPELLAAGVAGYLAWAEARWALMMAMRIITCGGACFSLCLLAGTGGRQNRRAMHLPGEAWTTRELQVLTLVAEGRGDEEIGRALGVCGRTVRNDLERIRRRVGGEGRSGVVAQAARQGLLPPH